MPEHTAFEDEGDLLVTVRYPFTRHGTVVTFEGEDSLGRTVTFGADWRAAQDIIEALYDDREPVAAVAPWSVLTITEPAPPAAPRPVVFTITITGVTLPGDRPSAVQTFAAQGRLADAVHDLLGLYGATVRIEST